MDALEKQQEELLRKLRDIKIDYPHSMAAELINLFTLSGCGVVTLNQIEMGCKILNIIERRLKLTK